MTNEPTLAAARRARKPDLYMKAPEQILTNEATDACENDRAKVGESIRAGSDRMAAIRAELLRKLNEQSREEASQANASHRPRPEWHKIAKTADRPKRGAARNEPQKTGTNTARTVGDAAELVEAGSGLTTRGGPA